MPIFNNYLKLFLLACLTGLFISCDLSNNDEFEETYTYSFQKDKQLVVDTTSRQITGDSTQTILNVSSESGNNLVFHYEKRVTAPPNVMDGGSITTVHFQIPPETSSFSFEGAELTNANVYFQRSCFCPIIGALEVENGVLEGQRISDNIWSVSASLQPQGPMETYTVEWNKTFIRNSE